ncbi:homoserine dehydrogenase [Synergistaceae bacterium OttesenSCG-928-I11]|nr:homoserine dehydrogenase [Synergistaceae bacterium OttesenSCG-928-I11]
MKTRALMIGFGSVGRALARMICGKRERLAGLGFDFQLVGVFTRTKGSLVDPDGLDLEKMLSDVEAHEKFTGPSTDMTPLEACRTLDYDVLIELSTLQIEGRGEPAASHIRAALSRGKNAVTANKGPVAFAYPELGALAEKNGCKFLFESTVMDGVPVINLVRRCMKGNRITGFSGILNSTTNYILTRMEEGTSLADATAEAQRAGIAEADPRNDIDGWDAAAKVSVLARVLMGADVTPKDVDRTGIRDVTPEKIREAAARGKKCKLVCCGYLEGGAVRTSVRVEELPEDDILARLSAFDSGICIESDLMVPNYIVQKDGNPGDTAFGVLEDMLSMM